MGVFRGGFASDFHGPASWRLLRPQAARFRLYLEIATSILSLRRSPLWSDRFPDRCCIDLDRCCFSYDVTGGPLYGSAYSRPYEVRSDGRLSGPISDRRRRKALHKRKDLRTGPPDGF
jgi:hypothetical protein